MIALAHLAKGVAQGSLVWPVMSCIICSNKQCLCQRFSMVVAAKVVSTDVCTDGSAVTERIPLIYTFTP